ncbi:MAG: AAA family ATPase, partial [Gemmatimonadales bacterium]|nr:AAA family ATPase [Gemmatimonadales bacterium]
TAVERLGEVIADLRRSGRRGRDVHCPAHEDANPSLSVAIGQNGKILLHCHAGCSSEAVVAAAGLSWAELSGETSRSDPAWTPRGPAIAVYAYADELGETLFEVCRTAGKQFMQRKPDPTSRSGYTWKLGTTRRVLYRLPDILRAAAAGGTIYVVEGEKDVAALVQAGAVATTNPGGAGKWRAEYSEALRGAHVVVVADRDRPGYQHAEEVRQSLAGIAASVRVVEAAAGKDAADHLAAGHRLSDFREVAVAPQASQAGPAETPETLPAAVRALDVEAGEPVSWLEYGAIPAHELTLLVGDPGGGKTSYALKIVAGKGAEGLTSLVISEEDPAEVLRNRLEAIAVGHRWDVGVVLRNVHILALSGCQLSEPRWQRHLLAEIKRTEATLVILDPLFELAGVDEDSNVAQRPLLRFLRELMVITGVTVIVLHHFGKAVEGKRKPDRVRGASAWFGAARAVYAIESRDDGLQVECLKLSRAIRPAPYVLERTVETDPENPGIWRSATFHPRTLRAADGDLAESWILEQITREPLTTTELRKLALGTGRSREDLAGALRRLEASGRITFDPGARGAKHWRTATLPAGSGKVDQSTLPTLPNLAPAGSGSPAGGCPTPFRGAGNLAGRADTDNDPLLGDELQRWRKCQHTVDGSMPPRPWRQPGDLVYRCGICEPQEISA